MPKLSESELQTALLDALHEYIGSDSVRDAVAVILPIIESQIDAPRRDLAEVEDELAEEKGQLDTAQSDYAARSREQLDIIVSLHQKLAPNPVCRHPMAFRAMETPSEAWERASTTGKDANGVDQGDYSGHFHCTLCREKEAAVEAALGQVFDHPFNPFLGKCKCGWSCNANSSLPCYEQWKQHIRAAPITPTQTSAQQGWVTNPGDTGYGRIKAAWDSAQQERK